MALNENIFPAEVRGYPVIVRICVWDKEPFEAPAYIRDDNRVHVPYASQEEKNMIKVSPLTKSFDVSRDDIAEKYDFETRTIDMAGQGDTIKISAKPEIKSSKRIQLSLKRARARGANIIINDVSKKAAGA